MAFPIWRYILHADLDAFYASVEQMDNPKYRGKPLVVGGSPEERGVVAAASYEARKHNIRSAMPMRTAISMCPQLVRVSPRFDRYREISRQIIDIFLELTPLVEPLSLDEAFLDISIQSSWESVGNIARDLKLKIKEQTGLVISIGGGLSKTVAKVSSQLSKPNGLLLIRPGEEQSFLAPIEVGILSGVGPKTAEVLHSQNVNTLRDLSACSNSWLHQAFGKRGPELKERAKGLDYSQVTPHRETKSVSSEVTMPRDVGDEAEIVERIEQLALGVASRLQRSKLAGKTITIKLRLADFTTITRQRTLPTPTSDAEVITFVACNLLHQELKPEQRFRLVGVGVARFQELRQLPLFPML
jgi:DNA polymerase-4